MATIEIRIHGVSGTPPDAMLATDPVEIEQRAGGMITVLAAPPPNPRLRAYRWSSLTSGTAASALWLALTPFMLCNLAGFALPRLSRRAHRAATLLVRLAGLALTAVFSFVTAQGFIDVGAYQYLHGELGWLSAGASLALGALTAALLVLFMWVILSRRQVEGPPSDVDPVEHGVLSGPELLPSYRVEAELRSIHLAVALLAVTWIEIDAVHSLGAVPPRLSRLVVLAALPLIVVGTTLFIGLGRSARRGPDALAIAAAAGLVWVSITTASTVFPAALPGDLSLRGHQMSLAVSVLVGLVAAMLATNLTAGRTGIAAVAPAFVTVAGASGAGIGAALIQVSADATGGTAPTWLPDLAAGYLVGSLVVLAVTLVTAIRAAPEPGRAGRERLWITIRKVRDRLEPVFVGVLAVTGLLTVGFVGRRFGWWSFEPDPRLAAGLAVTDAVLVVWLLVAVGLQRAAAWVSGAFLVTIAAARFGVFQSETFRGFFGDFDATATTLTVLLPLGLVMNRIVGAIRDRESRRGLAVLWDVGAFFPRWHHPFAPPSYGSTAVRDLADYAVNSSRAPGGVILAPHSQGSVIAVAALQSLDALPDDVALLTFGSPIGTLYRRYFPLLFGDLADLDDRLAGRWVNLFRRDDPIAGPISDSVDAQPLDDPHLRVHGLYWLEPEYAASVARLEEAVGGSN